MAIPSYVFATPVFGAQAALAVAIPFGRSTGTVDATLNGALGYVLAANGRYQTIAGYQTFSRIDRTTVRPVFAQSSSSCALSCFADSSASSRETPNPPNVFQRYA